MLQGQNLKYIAWIGRIFSEIFTSFLDEDDVQIRIALWVWFENP